MSNPAIDLWPSVFGYQETELPDAILREQANRLGEKTNHLVEARVEAPVYATYLTDKIRLGFYLVAPRLGNYSYRLFTIEYHYLCTLSIFEIKASGRTALFLISFCNRTWCLWTFGCQASSTGWKGCARSFPYLYVHCHMVALIRQASHQKK